MPTYEYQCDACGHHFEHFQSMSSRKLRKCPACAKPKLVRLVGSGAGVIFKGSGFYETDYKKSSPPPSEGSTSKDSGAKEGTSGGKGSDAKTGTSSSSGGDE